MDNSNTPDKYATLDGLRGVAAMLVVVVHFPHLFGLASIENGYLVVDLFFVMSGFVIGSAYEEKLLRENINGREFMRLRLIRLYPLYIAGTLLGAAGLLLKLPFPDWHFVGLALPLAILMLPSPVTIRIFYPFNVAPHSLYPLNFPSWSLFFELVGNAAYAIFFKRLTTRMLFFIVVLSGVMLAVIGFRHKTLDAGPVFGGSYVGFLRIAYSFSFGIILFRLRVSRRKISDIYSIVPVIVCLLMFCAPIPESARPAFIVFVLIFAIPVAVRIAASIEPSRWLRKVFLFFGMVSYGVYVLHVPTVFLIQMFLARSDRIASPAIYALGAAILLTVVALACLAEKYYDRPIRRRLLQGRQHQGSRHRAAVVAPINE
ncbi:acyltransferase [Paraburkholderia sp. BL10I2N1]|uniref:acyltransferase family protein n=1 Tax=Paraburkholderia sp. BL10I2N1 TaxID=1938796 RepID=UPI001415201D|nr:acyltransferase [Paraburkholderia sp. BL10I2N1]